MSHTYSRNLSCREIVALGKELRRKAGKPVSFRVFCRRTRIPAEVIRQMCGGWRTLKRLIEPEPPHSPKKKRSPRQLIELLKCCDKEGTQRITQDEFCALAGITRYELKQTFGSWRQLRDAAGMSRRSRPRRLYTNRELLDPLLLFYLRTGRRPSQRLIEDRGGRDLVVRLLNRFGAWKIVEIYFDAWLDMYFRNDDLNWTLTEHERTFVPDPHAQLEWPPDKAGLDWHHKTGWVHPDKL